jgi:hypothetical protein
VLGARDRERERALAEREVALWKRVEETRLQADERLAEVESQLLELERRQQELDQRERLLDEMTRERSQALEAAVVEKALFSAQRSADLLQAEAVQEAETTVLAATIEARAIVARTRHAREMADRDRADFNENLTKLRAALEASIARLDSLAPDALNPDQHKRAWEQGVGRLTGQTDEHANGCERELGEDLRSRAGVGQTGGEAVAPDT